LSEEIIDELSEFRIKAPFEEITRDDTSDKTVKLQFED
jgi:hypothetical protein